VCVDLVHCERQAAALADEPGGDASLVEGELVTHRYWDALAAEVDEELRSVGSVSFADLARRHGLSAERITAALAARLGSGVQGRLEGGLLYTDAHLARLAAQLRGALRATAAPCGVQELTASAFEGSPEAGSYGGIAGTLFGELLASGAAQGALRSGGLLWTPAAHARRQRDAIATFYAGNGLVGYDAAARAGVAQPRTWLAAQHPEGVHLDSAMVSPALLEQLEAALEEALTDAGWADVGAHLPPPLGTADAAAAAARSQLVERTVKGGGALLAECCVVSAPFLAAAADAARELGRAAGAAAATRRKASPTAAARAADDAADARGAALQARGGKGGRGGRAGRRAGGSDSDDDAEDWSTGPAKGKVKGAKGAKAARGKQQAGAAAAADERGGALRRGAGEVGADAATGAPSVEELQQQLERSHAALAHASDGCLGSALAEHVRAAAAAAFVEAMQAVLAEGSDERRRRLDTLTRRADEAFMQLQLLAKGAELFAGDDATAALLSKHLLRSPGADAADALLLLLQAGDDAPAALRDAVAAAAAGAPGALTEQQRSALARGLPAELRASGVALLDALSGRNVAALDAALEPLAAACGVRLKRLDKRSERALLAAHREALAAQLAAEDAPPAALLLAVPLLYAERASVALSLPGRALSAAVARLGDQLTTPEEQRTLSGFHDAVVALLQLRSCDGADAVKAAAEAKQAWLAAHLPALRQLAMAGAQRAGAQRAAD
jgi:hypothetical protein